MADIINQHAHFNSASDGALKVLDELRACPSATGCRVALGCVSKSRLADSRAG
jgi:hypothetical protein